MLAAASGHRSPHDPEAGGAAPLAEDAAHAVAAAAVHAPPRNKDSEEESLYAPRTAVAVLSFGLCNSVMLVLNKVTIHLLPVPSLVLVCQLAASALFVVVAERAGLLKAEPFERDKVRAFGVVALAFLAAVFCNAKVRVPWRCRHAALCAS